MVALVLLDVIGCSSINEQIGLDQKIQRTLDVLKEAARRSEEQQDWVKYAKVQNNLGVTYQLLAQRGVEPGKNLNLATQAFKEASAH
jgi:hypothetical protein